MRLSDRGKTRLAFGTLSAAAIAFEIALLATSEPLPPTGPIGALLDRGFDNVRAGAHGAPGLSIAIVRDGAIAYVYARGYADVTAATPVTPHTRFRAGSITKMFTALAAMQLVEAGRVSLDDTVAKYLPSAPHAREVTIRELLSQTSGLPNFTDMAFSTGLVAHPTTPDAILGPLDAQPLDFPPGTKYEYSNTNFVMLARTIEMLDGRPIAELERTRIFEPAGMTESTFGPPVDGAPVARGYDDAAGTKPTAAYDTSWLYGAGDLVTTATDLARFDMAVMSGKIVSLHTLAAMEAPLNDIGDGHETYGLGFTTASLGTRVVAGHHGGIPGFEADDEMISKANFAIVILGNNSDFYTAGADTIATIDLLPTDFALAEVAALRGAARDRASIDPGIEVKLRGLLRGIEARQLDRSTLTDRMNSAYTAGEVDALASRLPPYETLQRLTLLARSSQGKKGVYYFTAGYPNGDITYQLVVDPDGAIDGFNVR